MFTIMLLLFEGIFILLNLDVSFILLFYYDYKSLLKNLYNM